MNNKRNLIHLLFVLIAALLFSCTRNSQTSESDDKIILFGAEGVLNIGILSKDTSCINDTSSLVGGTSVEFDPMKLAGFFEEAEEAAFDGKMGEYEVAIAVTADEYHNYIKQLNNDIAYDAKAKYAFAYSYLTGELFGFTDGKTYRIKNKGEVKDVISVCFPTGYTASWYSSATEWVSIGEKQKYSANFEFRYERFFTDKKYQGDFIMPKSYHADEFKEMIINAAKAAGIDSFNAIIAVDRISGAYRVEYYPYADPEKFVHAHEYACFFFDSNFNYLSGELWKNS